MLMWLASYPRSGNTFVRVVLNDVFGVKTPSLSGEGDDRVFSARPGVMDAVGHRKWSGGSPDLISEARSTSALTIVKTHEPPSTEDPAIYIVRDGRSAVVSYYHYLKEIEHIDIPIESIIDGHVYAGGWSDHFAAWNPLTRPNTLLLRYEEITKDIDGLIAKVSSFCSAVPMASGPRTFGDLHLMYPEFFRKANDAANIAELEPHTKQFMRRHGELMRRLHYVA